MGHFNVNDHLDNELRCCRAFTDREYRPPPLPPRVNAERVGETGFNDQTSWLDLFPFQPVTDTEKKEECKKGFVMRPPGTGNFTPQPGFGNRPRLPARENRTGELYWRWCYADRWVTFDEITAAMPEKDRRRMTVLLQGLQRRGLAMSDARNRRAKFVHPDAWTERLG